MNNRVYIFDTTLRDGEQSLNSSLAAEQKMRIARQLARLKVDIIEAGFPVSSPGDFAAVEQISREVSGPVICGLARAVEKDILTCAKAIKHAKRPRIHTFIGTSAIHAAGQLRKTPDEIARLVRSSVSLARTLCDDVEFSPMDAARTDSDFLCRVIELAITCGAKTINIPDTVGYSFPEEFGNLIGMLYERVPNIDKAIISVHCHDDLGMATANSLTAVAHGARQVECSVNGIGERAGNTALEEIVMALMVRRKEFKLSCGVDTTEIMRTSKIVRDICGVPVQPNKAIVGSNAFSHSSGIHQDGVLKARKTYEIMTPRSIGLKDSRMVLTSRSGGHMVKSRLIQLGYAEKEINIDTFYARFIELADKKGTVYDDDLVALMEMKNYGDLKDDYKLEYLNVSSGTGTIATAAIRIAVRGNLYQEAACGDGAVDATTKAIDRITKLKIQIDDFHIDSITRGREALGKVTIAARTPAGNFTGTGASTDIVEASALAYMDIVNKYSRMTKFRKKTIKRRAMSGNSRA